ncbi:helix-turn-helix domain-containing protein [Enterococcus faecalis]|uniref:helix-turn-helix domain-containing protein n=1 Tax=Enterococcus faecalis TaxID=1351 RepID=UPI003D2C282A
MSKIIEKFSYETNQNERYEVIFLEEDVTIKNDTFKVKHEYYKRISDDELFEPFSNPDQNLEKDYNIYRERHNLLSAKKVKEIREKYELTIRDFSVLLGISYSNLSSIENGSIQANYIDSLIRLADDPYAFYKCIVKIKGKKVLKEKAYNRLEKLLEDLILNSYSEHQQIAQKVYGCQLDLRNNIIRIANVMEFETENRIKGELKWEKSNSNESIVESNLFSLAWPKSKRVYQ